MSFRPLLSATMRAGQIKALPYPLLTSPKLDGIRCIIHGKCAVSRNLKPFRNTYIQTLLAGLPEGLDGELIVGSPTEGLVLNRTYSGVMSEHGTPDFTFWIFDNYKDERPFIQRFGSLTGHESTIVKVVHHAWCKDPEELLQQQGHYLFKGYEGLMARGPYGKYKFGRASHSDNILWKLKDFEDGEIVVTGVLEGVENLNEPTTDATGRTVRSKHQENMVPNGKVGTILGTTFDGNTKIQVSPGRMTHDMRQYYWENQDKIIGKIAKYKVFGYGAVNVPRFATFQEFRDISDMS